MHVSGVPLDFNWFLQFIVTAFVIAFGLLHLVKNTASKYFMVDATFDSSASSALDGGGTTKMPPPPTRDACAVCGNSTTKQCSGCKRVRYCSETCQSSHWKSGHKTKCKDFQLFGKENEWQSAAMQRGRRGLNSVALVPNSGTVNIIKQPKEILFPYEDFVELFYWDKSGFPPCGLLNCGNSCFANVVLQCLSHTRPLVAYLLEQGHRRECRRNDWCFLCEFQTHVERASESQHPFSPLNILSRLPNIGGNLGYGKQEDAHEFMRFAIDTMQSVCLDEYGGEKVLHPSTQETTLVQHIFGGHLQSQVICMKCNKTSDQYENMMDLTVEIHGDATSLEECLDQFTVREQLHGDNMYKCDGCNDYVMAWKRLTVRRAPNILTIALKRFQSGRFGKLNKRVTFPETLDLGPYMSEAGDGNDIYKLYAVVVHVDMLNASFFGHYICYTKDFSGNWYRIDDCKVTRVDLEEVLSQGAYMLFYNRVCARPSCLKLVESGKEQQTGQVVQEEQPCARKTIECFTREESIDDICSSGSLSSDIDFKAKVSACEEELSAIANSDDVAEDMEMVDSTCEEPSSVPVVPENEVYGHGFANMTEERASPIIHSNGLVSGIVTSASETVMADAYSLHSESAFRNSGVDDKYRAENTAEKLTDSSSESSLPIQNGVCEEGETSHNGGLGSDDFLDETTPVISESEPIKKEIAKVSFPSGSIKDAASSGAKLKPLFPRGFLGKSPSNKPRKRVGEAPPELGEFAAPCNLNKGTSVSGKYGFPRQNGARPENVRRPHSVGNSSLPSTSFEVVGNCLDKDAALLSKYDEFANLCNGDSGAFVIPDKGISNIETDDHQFVEKPLSYDRDLR